MNRIRQVIIAGTAALTLIPSEAGLTSVYQFNGKGNWSIDGIGSNLDPVGTLSAIIPVGSTVEKALLLSSSVHSFNGVPNIEFAGMTYSGAAWTDLGAPNSLRAWSTDVTSQVQSLVGGGSAAPFSFSVRELSNNSFVDGEVLAIAYSNPAESERTIAFLTGASEQAGDTTTINFSSPLDNVGEAGFEAQLSLGIGFSFQSFGGEQRSIIDGNGRRLTSSAGGQDDGSAADGGLITVGGIGDSIANPDPDALPTNPRTDDELYNLAEGNVDNPAPFLVNGLTSYSFETQNPSRDDNIFFLGVNITASAGINQPPPPPPPPTNGVPDAGSTAVLLGITGAALVEFRRRAK